MASDTTSKFSLIIGGDSKQAEDALQRVRDRYASLLPATRQAAENFRAASQALDVRPMKLVEQELNQLREHYQRLSRSGLLSQSELARAATNLKNKTAELRKGQSDLNRTMTSGQSITSRLTGGVSRLVAAYASYRAITGFYNAVIQGSRDAEKAQFGLTSSVEAAGREFENTGGLDQWQAKVKTLSADLRIYSETDVANAAARTIDMTKRLGLSAEQMDVLIRRTADLSAGKTDLEGGIERVTAALRGEAEASEYLGLTLNENYVKAWHEAHNAHGTAWKDLTDLEKAQVRYNVMLEQTAATQGRAADSSRTFNGALQLMQAQVSNAIANNEDLGDALSRIATLVSDNAAEIAGFVSTLTSAMGDLIEFTIQNKELLGVLIGSGGLLLALSKTAGAISTVGTAMKSVGGIKTPDILSADGNINAALAARIGLYGALAVTLAATVSSYNSMRDAQNEAAEAAHRLALAEAEAQGIANAASASTGLQISSLAELNRLLREGKVVRDEVAGQYLTLEQAEAKAAAASERQALAEVDRAASFAEVTAIVEAVAQKYGNLSAETINAAGWQQILNEALNSVKSPVEEAAESVDNLSEAYYDAATALESLSDGQAGYDDALQKKLKAEADYVQAVEELRGRTFWTMQYKYREDERALKQSLDKQLLLEEDRLEQGFITQEEYDKLKVEAEEGLATSVLEMREATVVKAKELYGEDADEYREAVADKIDAELELARAQKTTKAANERFVDSMAGVGTAGEEGGRRVARGLREIGAAADEATDKIRKLTEEQKKQSTADYFGAQFSAIQQKMAGFKSLDELSQWASQVVTQKNGRALTNKDLMSGVGATGASAFTKGTNQYAQQLYIQKLAELSAQQPVARAAQPGGTAGGGKIMTVNLKSGSQTVAATVPEADAGRLLEVLRQAGMVTA